MPYKRDFAILAATTASAAPASLTDATLGGAKPFSCEQVTLLVRSTAGSGVMTAALKVWGFNPETARWWDLGQLATINESKADVLEAAVGVSGLSAFDRLYIEIVSLGGTATAVQVDGIAIQPRAVV